jgi:uncharacterized protein (TIGR02996 family)
MTTQADLFFTALFPDPQERNLVNGILDHPEDQQRRLIYADWLEEHGDSLSSARAEFLRGRHTLATGKKTGRLLNQLDSLRPQVGWEWLSVMGDIQERLADLQQKVSSEWSAADGWRDFLKIHSDRGLLDVHFYGTTMANAHGELRGWLVRPDLASVLRSLRLEFCGERGFANGTCMVDLDCFSQAPVEYPHLTSFEVSRELPGLVIHDFNEEGAIGRLLRKCGKLERLAMPSAPNASFFEGGPYPLVWLGIDAGYDTEHFLLNLSRATCFPHLRHLEYRDSCQEYMDDWRERTTPFAHYEALFRSPLMRQLESVVLQELALSPAQIRHLQAIRSEGVTIERHPRA